jgi:hemerythrin-like metal-binding protein
MAFVNDRELPDLGFPEIDAEHIKLVGLINKLHDASIAPQPGAMLRPALDELVSFTEKHFQDEERIMAGIGYPAMARHRDQHQELLQKLAAFRQSEEAPDPLATVTMLDFLKSWLKVHVSGEDIRLVIWHRSRRGSQSAWTIA